MNKENRTTRQQVIGKNVTPYPQKALLQLSQGVFLQPTVTSYSKIAHSPEMQFWTPQIILRAHIVTSHLAFFLD